jgi:2-oxoglutarate dehydrogenase E2 component (dihydrolipoamide succinyltransferase)
MSFSVQMPALGESVTEGTVTRWLKQEGDQVEVDEPLLEVSTDKVDTEIPSPAAGVLERIVAGEDETVEVGGELAVIGDGAGLRRVRRGRPIPSSRPTIGLGGLRGGAGLRAAPGVVAVADRERRRRAPPRSRRRRRSRRAPARP